MYTELVRSRQEHTSDAYCKNTEQDLYKISMWKLCKTQANYVYSFYTHCFILIKIQTILVLSSQPVLVFIRSLVLSSVTYKNISTLQASYYPDYLRISQVQCLNSWALPFANCFFLLLVPFTQKTLHFHPTTSSACSTASWIRTCQRPFESSNLFLFSPPPLSTTMTSSEFSNQHDTLFLCQNHAN